MADEEYRWVWSGRVTESSSLLREKNFQNFPKMLHFGFIIFIEVSFIQRRLLGLFGWHNFSYSCHYLDYDIIVNHLQLRVLVKKAERLHLAAWPMPILIPTGMKPPKPSMLWSCQKSFFVVFIRTVSKSLLLSNKELSSRPCWEEIWLHKHNPER